LHSLLPFEDIFVDATTTINSQGTEERNPQRQQQLARGVKSLIFNSAQSIKVKAPILALFSNLESSAIDRSVGLIDNDLDQYLAWMKKHGVTTTQCQ